LGDSDLPRLHVTVGMLLANANADSRYN